MKMKFFQHVKIGEKFCFSWLNNELIKFWFTKVGFRTFHRPGTDQPILIEDSIYSERVFVEEK